MYYIKSISLHVYIKIYKTVFDFLSPNAEIKDSKSDHCKKNTVCTYLAGSLSKRDLAD